MMMVMVMVMVVMMLLCCGRYCMVDGVLRWLFDVLTGMEGGIFAWISIHLSCEAVTVQPFIHSINQSVNHSINHSIKHLSNRTVC
jgi:hypothetical protein